MIKQFSLVSVLAVGLVAGMAAEPAVAQVLSNPGQFFIAVTPFASATVGSDTHFNTFDNDRISSAIGTPVMISLQLDALVSSTQTFTTLAISSNSSTTQVLLRDLNHGTVDLIDNSTASISSTGNPAIAGASAVANGSNDFEYLFDMNNPGTVTVNYTRMDTGVDLMDAGITISSQTFIPPLNGTGSVTFNVGAGLNTMQIFSGSAADAVQTNAVGNSFAASNDQYSFIISVPEPMTWLMMLVGFTTLGLCLRHRHRSPDIA
jgi:hypothetical protein